jgi:membrane fusion protein
MTDRLFRKEVIDAKRGSWLGQISLAQPLKLWMLALAAALAALVIVLFLIFGGYTRRTRVAGQLVPTQGLATVVAPAAGVISRIDTIEGAAVESGALLAVVAMPRGTVETGDTIGALETRLQQRRDSQQRSQRAQAQLFSVQQRGMRTQLANAQRELAQLEAEIETRQRQVRIANETLARLRQLKQQQFVSDLQLKQQENAALEQMSELQTLQRQGTGVRRQIDQLAQSLQELPAQREAADADAQRDRATLEQESLETETRRELAVVAPLAGIVATQLVKPGQAVQTGQPLLSVLPGDGKLEAELLVPSRAIGFIEPGDEVLLRYQAYPYQKFGHHTGKVVRISRSVYSSGESDARTQEPSYRVVVALNAQTVQAYGKAERLKPGMLLDADILGEKRSLIEWLFEPVMSLKSKLQASKDRSE